MNKAIRINRLREQARPLTTRQGKARPSSFWNRDISFSKRLADKTRQNFYLELGSLLESGIDIRSALELLSSDAKGKFGIIISQLLQLITAGSTFSDAMKKTGAFDPYEYFTIQIGEETGKLATVLVELNLFFHKRIVLRRQLIGVLIYPALVVAVAGGAITFMMMYVVPMFSDIYKRAGGELPFITRFIISVSEVLHKNFGWMTAVMLVIAIFITLQRRKERFRDISASIILKMPVWGNLVRKIYLARFAHTMSMLLEAQIPLVGALQLCRQVISFYPFERSLPFVQVSIEQGMPMHIALSKHEIYPSKMIMMVKVGEEVNELDVFFSRLGAQYSAEAEHQVQLLGKVIEPLIIVVLGIIVGIVLIAMYLPMFKLGQQF